MGDDTGESGDAKSQRYVIHELLGRGGSGLVYRAVDADGGEYAIKKIPLSKESREAIENEIAVMAALRGPHFVNLKETFFVEKDDEMWIVQEYCQGGSLADVMHHCQLSFNEEQVRWAIYSITSALTVVHSQHHIHRDIKGANVLLARDGMIKLTDLGVAALLDEKTQSRHTAIGSPHWMAPEVIRKSRYGVKADIWSLGITAIELAEGGPPMKDVHAFRALFLIPQQPPPTPQVDPATWSIEYFDFVQLCLKKDPAQRPSAEELLKHPFLQKNPDKLCLQELCAQVIDKMERVRKELAEEEERKKAAKEAKEAYREPHHDISDEDDSSETGSGPRRVHPDDDDDADSTGSMVVVDNTEQSGEATRGEEAYKRMVEDLRRTKGPTRPHGADQGGDKHNDDDADSTGSMVIVDNPEQSEKAGQGEEAYKKMVEDLRRKKGPTRPHGADHGGDKHDDDDADSTGSMVIVDNSEQSEKAGQGEEAYKKMVEDLRRKKGPTRPDRDDQRGGGESGGGHGGDDHGGGSDAGSTDSLVVVDSPEPTEKASKGEEAYKKLLLDIRRKGGI